MLFPLYFLGGSVGKTGGFIKFTYRLVVCNHPSVRDDARGSERIEAAAPNTFSPRNASKLPRITKLDCWRLGWQY